MTTLKAPRSGRSNARPGPSVTCAICPPGAWRRSIRHPDGGASARDGAPAVLSKWVDPWRFARDIGKGACSGSIGE